MKIEIETYKGQTIFYDDDYDKFLCDISIEDKFKLSKRASLKDIRKEIDTFIKINVDFKPFKAFEKSKYGGDGFTEVDFISIRTDGKFVGGRSHYDSEDMKRIMVFNQSFADRLKEMKSEQDELQRKHRLEVKEMSEKLVPVDLSRYEHIMNQKASTDE